MRCKPGAGRYSSLSSAGWRKGEVQDVFCLSIQRTWVQFIPRGAGAGSEEVFRELDGLEGHMSSAWVRCRV
jgi:hypothetical protein